MDAVYLGFQTGQERSKGKAQRPPVSVDWVASALLLNRLHRVGCVQCLYLQRTTHRHCWYAAGYSQKSHLPRFFSNQGRVTRWPGLCKKATHQSISFHVQLLRKLEPWVLIKTTQAPHGNLIEMQTPGSHQTRTIQKPQGLRITEWTGKEYV